MCSPLSLRFRIGPDVFDHSHVVVCLLVAPLSKLPRAPWKFNAFWLNLFTSHKELEWGIQAFFTDQRGTAPILVQWEALKVYFRGLLIAELTKIKKTLSGATGGAGVPMQSLERQYVQDPTDSAREV